MPDERNTETWQPPRGRVFKAVVWLILLLIALGTLAGLIVALLA